MSDEDLWRGNWANDPQGPPPEPLPLNLSSVSKPGPFPTHVLPPVMRNMVHAVAGNKQVPEDLPALFGLGCVATLAGPRFAVTRGHGWTEPLNLYLAAVMESGTGKSPAAADVIKPLRRVQKRMNADHVALVESKIDELDARRGTVSRDPAAANRIEEEIKELQASAKRPPRMLVGADSTVESLAESMSRNGGAAAILDAEGEFFGILSGRYTKQVPNLGLALKAYDGDYYEVGRIGRIQDDIERAVLTFAFGVQPSVMEAAAKDRAMVERGLLARFMFSLPASLVGLRDADGAPYDAAAMAAWGEALLRVYQLPVPDQDSEMFPALWLGRSARKRHVDFCDWIEKRLHPDDGDLGTLPGWASKHKGRVLRIAGLLHLVHGFDPAEDIGEQAMNAAIEVGQWAIGHAVAVFGMSAPGDVLDDSQCAEILAWIERTQPKQFTIRDATRGVRRNWATAATIAAAIDRLVALGHLTLCETKDRAGRRSSAFVPHPSLLVERGQEAA